MSSSFSKLSLLACALLLAGCETMNTGTAKGAAAGAALGAGTGAIIGHQTGRAGEGTAIGAGLGALSGALIGRAMDSNKKTTTYPSTSTSSNDKSMFCPIGGEQYANTVKYCPIHGVELKPIQ